MRLNVNGVESGTKVKYEYPPRADQLCILGSATYRNTAYTGTEPPPGIECSYSYGKFVENVGQQINAVNITTGKVVYVFDEKQRIYKTNNGVEKVFEVRENPLVWKNEKPTGKWVWKTLELSKGVEIRIGNVKNGPKIEYNDTPVELENVHSIFIVKL